MKKIQSLLLKAIGKTGVSLLLPLYIIFTAQFVPDVNATQSMDFNLVTDSMNAHYSGYLIYANDSSTVLDNMKVILVNDNQQTFEAFTGNTGFFNIQNIPTGNYHVRIEGFKEAGGINSSDALDVLKHFTSYQPLTGIYELSAEVSGDSVINSLDALFIQKWFVKMMDSFPSGTWLTYPQSITINPSGISNATLLALCYGDVNGSYYPAKTVDSLCGLPYTDDRDGQVYPTVKIGNQCWMAKNLNIGIYAKSYVTGSPHSDVHQDNTIEKYCYDNDTANCSVYGGLYDWKEMLWYQYPGNQDICPDGWRVPTSADWDTLFNFYGGAFYAGDFLKQGGSSGFNALFSGYRASGGNFVSLETITHFWHATEDNNINAWSSRMTWGYPGIQPNTSHKVSGYSVRCIR